MSISVKVPVQSVIASLEAKIAADDAVVKANEKANAEYKKAHEAWLKAVYKAVKTLNPTEVRCWSNVVTLRFEADAITLPDEPEYPRSVAGCLSEHERSQIQNAIRILRMTDETHVSAATFKAISKYL